MGNLAASFRESSMCCHLRRRQTGRDCARGRVVHPLSQVDRSIRLSPSNQTASISTIQSARRKGSITHLYACLNTKAIQMMLCLHQWWNIILNYESSCRRAVFKSKHVGELDLTKSLVLRGRSDNISFLEADRRNLPRSWCSRVDKHRL